jgi:hypothetical protein
MTVRDRLRGWYRFLFVALLAVGALASAWPDDEYTHVFRLLVIGALAASGLTLFVMGFRCPSCRATLLPQFGKIVMGGPVACSRCGASIDSQA